MCDLATRYLKCSIVIAKLKYLIGVLSILILLYIAYVNTAYIKLHFTLIHHYGPQCASKPTKVNTDNLKCPFISLKNITLTHDQNAPIIVTFANAAWMDLMHNFICQARRAGLNRILVVALSEGVCDKLPGSLCWYPNITLNSDLIPNTKLASREGTWGSKVYQKLLLWRTPILYSLLKCNRTLLVADNDVVFLRNPVSYLQDLVKSGGYDIMFQRDATGVSAIDWLAQRGWLGNFYVCAGFMYMKPTPATLYLIQGIMAYQELDWNDQAGINTCLLYQPKMRKVKWRTLPSLLFTNGAIIKYGIDRSRVSLKPYLYHFNWHNSIVSKVYAMKKLNVWCSH